MMDPERFPTLTPQGRAMLDFLRNHPAAPVYRNQSGNKLVAGEPDALRVFEDEVAGATVGWAPGARPDWLDGIVAQAFAHADGPPRGPSSTTVQQDLAHGLGAGVVARVTRLRLAESCLSPRCSLSSVSRAVSSTVLMPSDSCVG